MRAVPSADGNTIALSRPDRLFYAQVESLLQGAIGHTYVVFPGGRQFLLSTFTELPPQALKLIRNIPR